MSKHVLKHFFGSFDSVQILLDIPVWKNKWFPLQLSIPMFSIAEFRTTGIIVQLRRRRKLMAFSAYGGSGTKSTLEWNFGQFWFLWQTVANSLQQYR